MENNFDLFLKTLRNNFNKKIDASIVFGNPIKSGNKTIIPTASIAYGVGYGKGSVGHNQCDKDTNENPETDDKESNYGNAGGGLKATPLGIFEVTDKSTRFMPVLSTKAIVVLILLSSFCFKMIFKKKKKKKK